MPRIPLARDAVPYVGGLAAAALLSLYWSPWLSASFVALLLFIVFFFRDPHRTHAATELQVLAPADGRVVQLRVDGERKTMSIFLSVLDVHVNRAPVSGVVEKIAYHRGSFQAAFRHGASSENERNAITIRSAMGTVTAVQIAGLLARRIVCTLREGDEVRAGDRIGMIKFGSRMDVLVPSAVAWTVAVGDRVRAGVTVVGTAVDAGPPEKATGPAREPGARSHSR